MDSAKLLDLLSLQSKGGIFYSLASTYKQIVKNGPCLENCLLKSD